MARGKALKENHMYAVGIDSGTQGTKALVIDGDSGEVLGRGYAPHAMIAGLGPGASEQNPESWIAALETALREALGAAGVPPAEVVAIGVSGQQHGFVPLGKDGRPLRPAKLWNDTSTVEETEIILSKLGGRDGAIRTLGISPAVGFTASKILWLKRHEPENFDKLAAVLLPHNYLNYHLTGNLHMEFGDASGTGLMDIRKRTWSKEALEAVDPGLGRMLPALSHPREPVGRLRGGVAARFGLSRALVSAGGGDNMMGAIGTGNVIPGVCTLSLGTSGTIYSCFDRPFTDPAGEIAAFCDSTGGWLPLLCTMNVTNTTELFKELHGLSNESLETLAAEAGPGAGNLMFLPFIDGERVPVLPQGTGAFFGLNRKTFNRACMARAVMEGTIFNLGYGLSRMRSLGLAPSEIRATGGGSGSLLWLRIVADIFKTPVITLREREAAAFGAAIQAVWSYRSDRGESVRIEDLTQTMVRPDRLAAEPDPGTFGIYDILQDRFNSLWKTLAGEFESQARIPSAPKVRT
jgi:xylulokinase